MTLSSEHLERKAEESRARLSEKLEELRARITPGEVVDQLVDYVRDSGGEFMRTLGYQVRRNPLPVALIGAGMAWLMTEKDGERLSPENRRAGLGDVADRASRAGAELGDRARGAATDVKDRLSNLADRATSTVSSLGDSAAAAFSGTMDAASGTAQRIGGTAASAGRRAALASRSFSDFCTEQPLVLAGFGFALGGALGAAFPSTQTESRLLGDASDQFKARAHTLAADAYDKAANVADGAYQSAAREAKRQGMGVTEVPATSSDVPSAFPNPGHVSGEAPG